MTALFASAENTHIIAEMGVSTICIQEVLDAVYDLRTKSSR
jgi:hypothetical protein